MMRRAYQPAPAKILELTYGGLGTMTVLDMADARSRRVGMAMPEVTISVDEPRAGGFRVPVERHPRVAGMES